MSVNIGNQIQGIRSNQPNLPVLTAEALDGLSREVVSLQRSVDAISASIAPPTAVLTQQLMGTQDGINNIFTVSVTPKTILIFRNGAGSDGIGILGPADYTIAGGTITFSAFSIPQPNDKLWALIWP